jgi:phosphatidylcholine synthase
VRWRRVNLTVCLLWVVFGGWAVWENFGPPQPVKLGLLAASAWLLVVGIVMQLVPEREAVGAE